jgi:dCMP deaminase
MTDRDPFPLVWMDWARRLAEGRSTCPRLKVGAVIVSPENVPLVAAYNGSAPREPHCTDVGCLIDPDTGRCKRTIHAERNAINHAARYGIRIDGATLYVTAQPCVECSVSLLTSGIRRVVYGDPYPHPEGVRDRIADVIAGSGIAFLTLPEVL